MKLRRFLLTTAMAALVFTGCKNDDEQPIPGTIGISVAEDSYEEGAGAIVVTFSTTSAFDADVSINYEVTGTATSGEDYEALSGTATLSAGETTLTQDITLLDDNDVESSEEITLTITAINGAKELIGSDGELTFTITDNDSFPFENGILVLHEGNFGGGNASVSFISDNLNEVHNGIFKTANEVDAWGDTAQSMAFNGDLGYIVVNGSQKVEVVNRYTFESVATIGGTSESDFLNPRYMAIANGKGYVTNWGDGSDPNDDFVAVVNLENNTVESKIPVGEGPERLLAKDNTIYVAHKGGFSQNNIVSVIDATTNAVTTTITVGLTPNSLQMDAIGNLWVLSGGYEPWGPADTNPEAPGQLNRIDVSNNSVDATFNFTLTEHPKHLSINEGTLYYYLAGSVYKLETSASELPSASELTTSIGFYRMSVLDGKLYGVNQSFRENGTLEIYDLSDNGLLLSQEVSIGPGEVYFNGDFEF